MKVLIISDSHGLEDQLLQIKLRYEDKVDYMLHCGDSELAFNHEALKGFIAVKGNCDMEDCLPNETVIELKKLKLFATHGHLYNVKMTLMNLQYRAEELQATIVCFGHSHIAGSEQVEGKIYINPGSVYLPRGRKEQTYCVIELQKNQVNVKYYDSEHNQVPDLCHTYML